METMRVLIVDDDPNVRRVLARTFENAGYAVGLAIHGEMAVTQLETERYDVMICDIQMPKMTGEELCHHLTNEGPYLPEYVLIVTSRTAKEARSWTAQYPQITVVEKPVGPRQLLQLVREMSLAGVVENRLETCPRIP